MKGVTPSQLAATGARVVLGNTYHLALRPGDEIIQALGGLHRFMAWDGPILTDSGGYQVFSLGDLRKITDAGAVFRSHIDGKLLELTPERAVAIQENLGADIAMCLDECPATNADAAVLQRAVQRSILWAGRCRDCPSPARSSVIRHCAGRARPGSAAAVCRGVGAVRFRRLRAGRLQCRRRTGPDARSFAGLRLLLAGGEAALSDGGWPARGHSGRGQLLASTCSIASCRPEMAAMPRLSRSAARCACGTPDIGATRLRLKSDCPCYACRTFSRAYIHHLFQVEEMLGPTLLSIHNIAFYLRLMAEIRTAIRAAPGRISSGIPGPPATMSYGLPSRRLMIASICVSWPPSARARICPVSSSRMTVG